MGLKIAVAGKGGVGKTTLAAGLVAAAAAGGWRVLAVDADPDANLAAALGFSQEERAALVPLSSLKEMIDERTGAAGSGGAVFSLNPRVDDLPDELAAEHDGVRLLVMGGIEAPGSGCACPESALLKALLRHLVLERDEMVVVDFEAGLEHLGRATARGFDLLLIVLEPGRRSLETGRAVSAMATGLGFGRILYVLNRARDEAEAAEFSCHAGLDFDIVIPYLEGLRQADLEGRAATAVPPFMSLMDGLLKKIEGRGV